MATVNPYITYNGNCEEAFNHYKSIFGGEFTMLSRFSEMPPQEGMELSADQMNHIMHVELTVSDEFLLMGSDIGGEWASENVVGNNITLSITADSKEQADQFYASLSEGGKASMPMEKTFWGSYFGMCTDKYGIHWMISSGAPTED